MKPFIMVSTRRESSAAEREYSSFLTQSGLPAEDLHHVPLEEADLLSPMTKDDVSGVMVDGGPYHVSTVSESLDGHTATHRKVEEELTELIALCLTKGLPLLVTGFGLEVLARYLGGTVTAQFAEEIGSADVYLTEEGREDPVLAGMPQAFAAFVGHAESVDEVPPHAVLLGTSPDCPVQLIRVGSTCYGTQFSPELDAERYAQKVQAYEDAGYGYPGSLGSILDEAVSVEQREAGGVIRGFIAEFQHE